jgi:hypothetical protein
MTEVLVGVRRFTGSWTGLWFTLIGAAAATTLAPHIPN